MSCCGQLKKHVITIIISTSTTISITFTLKKVYPVIPPAQGLNQRQINRVSFTIINIAIITIITIDVLIAKKCLLQVFTVIITAINSFIVIVCYSLTRKSMISMLPLGLTRCTDNIYDLRNTAYSFCFYQVIILRLDLLQTPLVLREDRSPSKRKTN